MTFRFLAPDVIRSASQRALIEHWDELAAGRLFPVFSELNPDPAMHDPRQLVVWAVEGEGRLRKFRAMYQGENVAEVFNSSWAGKTMEQVVPMSLRGITLEPANECAASGCAVYMIFSTIDANDQWVDCERLLLPFGSGAKVEHILASLQLTVVGSRPGVLKHFDMQADVRLQGKVRSGFSAATPGAAAGHKRRATRRNVARAARISFARHSMTCIIRNLSATGAAVEASQLASIPDSFRLMLEMESTERRCQVVWRRKNRIGVQFM